MAMNKFYIINGKSYLDTFLLREYLGLKKYELQVLMESFQFPEKEVVSLQNKKLYSLKVLNEFIETLIKRNERQINGLTEQLQKENENI